MILTNPSAGATPRQALVRAESRTASIDAPAVRRAVATNRGLDANQDQVLTQSELGTTRNQLSRQIHLVERRIAELEERLRTHPGDSLAQREMKLRVESRDSWVARREVLDTIGQQMTETGVDSFEFAPDIARYTHATDRARAYMVTTDVAGNNDGRATYAEVVTYSTERRQHMEQVIANARAVQADPDSTLEERRTAALAEAIVSNMLKRNNVATAEALEALARPPKGAGGVSLRT